MIREIILIVSCIALVTILYAHQRNQNAKADAEKRDIMDRIKKQVGE